MLSIGKINSTIKKIIIIIYWVYLNVLMVAIPFSTVSGVLPGSCDPSLGAIFVARVLSRNDQNLKMK